MDKVLANRERSRRILMIAPTPFFADRGCHVRILGEVKALKDLGHQLKICTYHLGKEIEDIETLRTMSIPWYKKLSAGPSIHKFYIDLLLLFLVLKTCRTFRPDILHAHLHEGIVIGKIASVIFRVPLIADLQGSLTEELLDHHFIPNWNWLSNLVRWIEKVVNELPQYLIASSTSTARLVMDRFGLGKDRVAAIGDGADLEMFYPDQGDSSLRNSLGITQQEKVVVFVGVLARYQGIDLLLEAITPVVQEIPEVKFLVIGYPEETYKEKAKLMGLEKHVIFTGKVPYGETPKFLGLGTIAVSPKISKTEANLKLLVYMAMGLPTVVFDNSINREILEDLGVYAKNEDAVSLALSIVALLRDDVGIRELSKKIHQKAVTSYSWESVGRRLNEVYEQHLDEHFVGKGG